MVDCVLASSANNKIVLWDVSRATEIISFKDHEELVQSISWRADGSRLVSAGRDKTIRIWDHRKPDSCTVGCRFISAYSHAVILCLVFLISTFAVNKRRIIRLEGFSSAYIDMVDCLGFQQF